MSKLTLRDLGFFVTGCIVGWSASWSLLSLSLGGPKLYFDANAWTAVLLTGLAAGTGSLVLGRRFFPRSAQVATGRFVAMPRLSLRDLFALLTIMAILLSWWADH